MLNVPLIRHEAVVARAAMLAQLIGELKKVELKRTRYFFSSHEGTKPLSANGWRASKPSLLPKL